MNSYFQRTLNRTFYYGFSSILGRIIGFLMLPIYTNYLTPADYGVAGFLILYVSLAQTLLGARLEQSISKFHYDTSIKSPLSSIWLAAVLLTSVVSLLPLSIGIFFSAELSNILFRTDEYAIAVAIISLNILFGTLEIYGLHYIKIIDLPKLFLYLNVAKLLVQLAINVLLVVVMKIGVLGVVVSSAASAVILTILTFAIFVYKEKALKLESALFKPLLMFSAPLWASGFVGLYAGSVHQVFINYSSGLNDLGLYTLANTFGALVAALALGPFFNYWQVERFRIFERANALEIYRKVFYGITVIALLMSAGISVYSGPIIELMADEAFHPAIDAVAPLCIFNVLMYLGWYLNFSFLVTNNNREIAINGLVYAVIITAIYAFAIPLWGFRGAAYGIMFGNIINFTIIFARAKQYYNMKLSVVSVFAMIACSLSLSYALTYISSASNGPVAEIVFFTAVIASGCLLLILTAFLFRPVTTKAVMQQLRSGFREAERK